MLRQFLLRDMQHIGLIIKDDGAAAGGALIDGKD